MRFEVPQFIEIEDKMFGPLTFKQFIYLAGGAAPAIMVFVVYDSFFLAFFLGGPFILLALALSFYKINNRPFIEIMQSAIEYTLNRKLYLWKKAYRGKKSMQKKEALPAAAMKPVVPKITQNRLKELAWSLDIKESLYSEETKESKREKLGLSV